jgi:hypothetical protein
MTTGRKLDTVDKEKELALDTNSNEYRKLSDMKDGGIRTARIRG